MALGLSTHMHSRCKNPMFVHIAVLLGMAVSLTACSSTTAREEVPLPFRTMSPRQAPEGSSQEELDLFAVQPESEYALGPGDVLFVDIWGHDDLSGRHTIFGACDEAGLAKVKEIARVPRDGMDKPVTPVVLEAVEISAR